MGIIQKLPSASGKGSFLKRFGKGYSLSGSGEPGFNKGDKN